MTPDVGWLLGAVLMIVMVVMFCIHKALPTAEVIRNVTNRKRKS